MQNPFADIDLSNLDDPFFATLIEDAEDDQKGRFVVNPSKKLLEKVGEWIIWEFGEGQFLVDDLVTGDQKFYLGMPLSILLGLLYPDLPKQSFVEIINEGGF